MTDDDHDYRANRVLLCQTPNCFCRAKTDTHTPQAAGYYGRMNRFAANPSLILYQPDTKQQRFRPRLSLVARCLSSGRDHFLIANDLFRCRELKLSPTNSTIR